MLIKKKETYNIPCDCNKISVGHRVCNRIVEEQDAIQVVFSALISRASPRNRVSSAIMVVQDKLLTFVNETWLILLLRAKNSVKGKERSTRNEVLLKGERMLEMSGVTLQVLDAKAVDKRSAREGWM